MRTGMQLVLIGLVTMSLAAGCATRSKTTVVERRVESPAAGYQSPPAPQTVVERQTTTEVERKESHPRGVLSTTVHVVGEIVSLPFRLVGGLLRLIF